MSKPKAINIIVLLLSIFSIAGLGAPADSAREALIYYGTSDASAAVAVGEDMFIAADDENNVLRVYKAHQGSQAVFSYDLTQFLGIDSNYPEADIEGATIIGDRIYWISSHGRNTDGKMRPNRYRFFATTVKTRNEKVSIRPTGVAYQSLVHSLVKTETMHRLKLDQATRFDANKLKKNELKKLAPKKEGLNIEGLCASSDGKTIYIGFRNPRLSSKAIVIPLKNPAAIVEKQQPPIFAEPMLWDLGGLGIRSMEYSHFHKVYFIIAGPHDKGHQFSLYRWSGEKDTQPVLLRQIFADKKNFTPEALVTFRNQPEFLLLSDDGSLLIKVSDSSECMEGKLHKDGKCLNKYLTDPNRKHFRAIWLMP